MTAAELWARLSDEGIVDGARPEPAPPDSLWFVRVMLGIAGWIGAAFLFGFAAVAMNWVVDDAASAMIAGAVCCAGAFALFRFFQDNDFAEQFALALSLAGQGLLFVGLGQLFRTEGPAFYVAIAAVEALLVFAVANPLHRLLAAGGTAAALALAVDRLGLPGLAAPLLCAALALVWLDPGRWATRGRFWRSIGYGLVLALSMVEVFHLFGSDGWYNRVVQASATLRYGPLIGRGLTGAVLVWAAATLAIREGFPPASRPFPLAVGAAILLGVVGMAAPGLDAALLILLLGVAAGNAVLMAFGILGLFGFVAHFYYSLDATLLAKSGLLALTGLCLLAASWFLRRVAGVEEPRHA